MKKALWLVAAVAVLAVVVMLAGCGGGDAGKSAVATAGKPGGGLADPPWKDGTIFFHDYIAGKVFRVAWTGPSYDVVQLSSPTIVTGGISVARSNGTRYVVYQGLLSSLYHALAMWESYPAGGYHDLTPGADAHVSSATVSPDGLKLAWTQRLPPGQADQWHIYVAPLVFTDGLPSGVDANQRFEVCNGVYPCWSPDGMRLAFQTIGGGIGVANAAAGQTPALVVSAGTPLVEESLNWAPGSRIAYAEQILNRKGRVTRYDIRSVNPGDSSDVVAVTSSANASTSWNDYPTYSPDGTQLAYRARSTMSGDSKLRRVSANGLSSSVDITGALAGRVPRHLVWTD